MGIPVLTELEKLIAEDGPPATVRERLAIANDQFAALKEQLADARRRMAQLEAEKHRLVQENMQLNDAVRHLEEQLPGRHDGRHEHARKSILLLLAQRDGLTADQVAQAVACDHELASFHLEALETRDFLVGQYSYLSPTTWRLSQEGRRYLVIQGLLG